MSVAGRSTVEVKSKIKTRRILIVDDEPDIAFALKTILEENGLFQVYTFHDAESALSIFRPACYDLALLDIIFLVYTKRKRIPYRADLRGNQYVIRTSCSTSG
jgi:PleD family two-component response regulator